MAWVAVLVMKSVPLDPVSAEKATVLTRREHDALRLMLAKPRQPEIQLISHEADNRRSCDDGNTCPGRDR